MENISRRTAIKTFLAGGVALATTGIEAVAAAKKKTDVKETLKGNVRHSVSNGVSAIISWTSSVRSASI